MKIQKGLVKYKDRSDIVCTYGITDDGKQFYFINDRKLSNNNIIVTSALVEAIDHSVVPANIGVIDSEGNIVIDCVNKSIKLITKDILLVEKANPTSPSVVEALKNRKDPLAATKLVSNSAAIKEKMANQMGSDARFIFNDQFSEASLFDIGGKNLLNDKYYSFIALNKRGDTIFLSDNVQTSGVDNLSLTSMKFNDTTNVDASIPSNLGTDNKLDVTDASVNKENIDAAMGDNISKLGDDTVSVVPPVVDDLPAVPEIPTVPEDKVPEVPSGVVVPTMNVTPEKEETKEEEKNLKIEIPPVTVDEEETIPESGKEEVKEEKEEDNLRPNQFVQDGKIVIPARTIQDFEGSKDEEVAPKPEEPAVNARKIVNDGGYVAIPAKAIDQFNKGEFPSSLDEAPDIDAKKKEDAPEEKEEENYDDVDVVDISIAGVDSEEKVEENIEEVKEEPEEKKEEAVEEAPVEENKEEETEKKEDESAEEAKEELISSDLLAGLAGNDNPAEEKNETDEVSSNDDLEEIKEETEDDKEEVVEDASEEPSEEEPKEISDEPVKIDDDSAVEDLLNGSSEIDDFLNSDTSSVLDDTYRYVPKKENTSITSGNNIMDNAVDTITRLIEANKNQKNELNQYKNQVTELTDLNKKVVDKARSDREKVKSSIQNYEVEITKLKAQMESLESKINEKESTIKNQTKELADLRTQVEGSNNLAKVLADAQSLLGE